MKEQLRYEYEAETGKSHGNALFSTTSYACWLEKRLAQTMTLTTKLKLSIAYERLKSIIEDLKKLKNVETNQSN